MVSKKHMVWLAANISRMPVELTRNDLETLAVVFFQRFNERFDEARFRDACAPKGKA